jgi:hypothetical protein
MSNSTRLSKGRTRTCKQAITSHSRGANAIFALGFDTHQTMIHSA